MAVVGNIGELGNWKDFTAVKMVWSEGHFWQSENLVVSSASHFLYKYVIMNDGKAK